jgi:hypothetical protein
VESLTRSPLTDPPFAFKKKLFWENKQRKKASSAPGYINPYLSALDVVVVVLVVHERQNCWYEDGLMYLPQAGGIWVACHKTRHARQTRMKRAGGGGFPGVCVVLTPCLLPTRLFAVRARA